MPTTFDRFDEPVKSFVDGVLQSRPGRMSEQGLEPQSPSSSTLERTAGMIASLGRQPEGARRARRGEMVMAQRAGRRSFRIPHSPLPI